jgi:amino acid transporter
MNPPTKPGLVRALGPLMATAVVIGTVIGSGVFKKPQTVAENVHYFGLVALVWVMTGVLAFLGALSLAEVAVLYPKAGGNYVYLREGYGRLGGFLWGWVEFWIIRSASIAALATIFAESLHDVLRNRAIQDALHLDLGSNPLGFWQLRILTVAVIVGLALVNVRGVRWGGSLQLLITLVKVGSLLAIFLLPFIVVLVRSASEGGARPQVTNLAPTWPDSWRAIRIGGIGSAFLAVLWAYHGWMNIAPVAEEVTKPQRNIPLALLAGVFTIIALYLGANLAYSLVIPREEMTQMKEPSPEERENLTSEQLEQVNSSVAVGFSRRLLGDIGVALAAAAIMISVFGALNGNLLVGPRLLYAMGEDGLAPRALGAVHPRFHTPAVAILVMAAWAALLVVGVAVMTDMGFLDPNKSHFDVLTDFAMFGAVIFETMAVLSIFVFRRRYPLAPRPYRCWGYPLTPALYVILPLFILGNMFVDQQKEAMIGVGFIGLGAAVYLALFRGMKHTPALPGGYLLSEPAGTPGPETGIQQRARKI